MVEGEKQKYNEREDNYVEVTLNDFIERYVSLDDDFKEKSCQMLRMIGVEKYTKKVEDKTHFYLVYSKANEFSYSKVLDAPFVCFKPPELLRKSLP